MRVLVFPTCLGDLLAPATVEAAIRVLAATGVEARAVHGATCCGQPAFNSGYDDAARRVARTTVRAIGAGEEPVVVPAGSCAAMMARHWPHLFRGDRDEQLARAVAGRVREWSTVVADHADALPGLTWHGRIGYHDSCHMLRELRIQAEPRALLERVSGVELVELPGAARCCGFGGTFSVRYPDVSLAMADAKLDETEGLDALVACDGGCLMHLGGRAARRGDQVRPMHLATLLGEALDGAS